jgi:hypothetical protein
VLNIEISTPLSQQEIQVDYTYMYIYSPRRNKCIINILLVTSFLILDASQADNFGKFNRKSLILVFDTLDAEFTNSAKSGSLNGLAMSLPVCNIQDGSQFCAFVINALREVNYMYTTNN